VQRQETVVPRLDEIWQESAPCDIHLVEINDAQLLDDMIADIAAFQHKTLELPLNRQVPLLYIGSREVRIDQSLSGRRARAGVVIILRRPRNREGRRGNGGRALGESFQVADGLRR